MARYPASLASGAVPQGPSPAQGSQAVRPQAARGVQAITIWQIVDFGVLYAAFFVLGHWLQKEARE
jgi:hypothetical protein